MTLKSYRLTTKRSKKKARKGRGGRRGGIGTRGMIAGGVTALIGIGLLSETSRAVGRI